MEKHPLNFNEMNSIPSFTEATQNEMCNKQCDRVRKEIWLNENIIKYLFHLEVGEEQASEGRRKGEIGGVGDEKVLSIIHIIIRLRSRT